jgi:hypothetical protein
MAEVVAQLKQQVASQNRELEYARLKIQVLEERLRLVRIQKYSSALGESDKTTSCPQSPRNRFVLKRRLHQDSIESAFGRADNLPTKRCPRLRITLAKVQSPIKRMDQAVRS